MIPLNLMKTPLIYPLNYAKSQAYSKQKKAIYFQLLIKKKLVNSLSEAINLINNRKVRVSNYNSKFLFEHTLVNEDSDIKILEFFTNLNEYRIESSK